MARQQNELSGIQQNEEAFKKVCAQISRFSADYLAEVGTASRTTIYKYQRREPVNPGMEEAILDAIKKAIWIKEQRDSAKVKEVQGLLTA